MIDLDYFCREYDGFISPQYCDHIVKLFDLVSNNDPDKVRQLSACKGNCNNCSCNRMDLNMHPEFKDVVSILSNKINEHLNVYKQDVGIMQREWPERYGWEFLTIKKYKPGGERHKAHSDEEDLRSSKRFLTMITYLTDDFIGGGTRFLHTNKICNPEQGKLLMFPSAWPWIHEGIEVTGTNSKYILITRLHYTE